MWGPGREIAIADAKDKVVVDCETVRGAALPSISIGDTSVAEGNSGTTPLVFQLTLSKPVTWNVAVAYRTGDDTAKAGSDYAAAKGTISFAPGEATKTIEVQVNGDTVSESDETLTISLSGAVNATIADGSATGTITNDDHDWHRVNSDHAHPPEHERLQCVEGANWVCQYSKVPEPALDFQWTPQDGAFIGLLTPLGQWTCPSWFPSVICANANRVAQGTRSFEPVSNGTIREDLIITKSGNHEQMYDYWVGQHVCPWYQTL